MAGTAARPLEQLARAFVATLSPEHNAQRNASSFLSPSPSRARKSPVAVALHSCQARAALLMTTDQGQRRRLSSSSSTNAAVPLSPRTLSSSLPSQNSRDDVRWRDELARTRHELRLCRAELQACQLKLGIKPNLAPFGSSSPRRRASAGPELDSPRSQGGTSEDRHGSLLRVAEYGSPWTNGDSVAVKRSLAFDDNATPTAVLGDADTRPRSVSPRPRAVGNARVGSENPFFGNAGAARDRLINSAASSQSTSGKMIATLQSDILHGMTNKSSIAYRLRSSLDTTRNQLRMSQRAVETLNRQNDELKDTKTRLLQEIESLKRSLERRERNTNELLARARAAELSLDSLRTEMTGSKQKMKALEESAQQAETIKAQSLAAQDAVTQCLASLSQGFKTDVAWLRQDLTQYEQKYSSLSSDFRTLSEDKHKLEDEVRSILEDMSNDVYAASTAHAELSAQTRRDAHKVATIEQDFMKLRRAVALDPQNW
ncbi:hypothetical protein OIV83_001551 [Microbotryomycetes sp. JL201]|nr:hypothetical protein OIV83_001551 [Microbotryomycetes sp. JL201]